MAGWHGARLQRSAASQVIFCRPTRLPSGGNPRYPQRLKQFSPRAANDGYRAAQASNNVKHKPPVAHYALGDGALLGEFHEKWKTTVSPALGDKLSNSALTLSKATFSGVNEMTRAAVRIPQNRNLTPEQLQLTCQFAFEQILGR